MSPYLPHSIHFQACKDMNRERDVQSIKSCTISWKQIIKIISFNLSWRLSNVNSPYFSALFYHYILFSFFYEIKLFNFQPRFFTLFPTFIIPSAFSSIFTVSFYLFRRRPFYYVFSLKSSLNSTATFELQLFK